MYKNMAEGNLFLFGEDALDDVRAIRSAALSALTTGTVVRWGSQTTSVEKILKLKLTMDEILQECNYFLRLYDPAIRATNPVVKHSKVNLIFPF